MVEEATCFRDAHRRHWGLSDSLRPLTVPLTALFDSQVLNRRVARSGDHVAMTYRVVWLIPSHLLTSGRRSTTQTLLWQSSISNRTYNVCYPFLLFIFHTDIYIYPIYNIYDQG